MPIKAETNKEIKYKTKKPNVPTMTNTTARAINKKVLCTLSVPKFRSNHSLKESFLSSCIDTSLMIEICLKYRTI